MRFFSILFIFLFCATALHCHGDTSNTMTTQNVTHVLKSVPDLMNEDWSFITFILEDGSAWTIWDYNSSNPPHVNDIVKNHGENQFFNITTDESFSAVNIGNIINVPLSIQKHYSSSLRMHMEEFGWKSPEEDQDVETLLGNYKIHHDSFELSNGCIYFIGTPALGFHEWSPKNPIHIIRPGDQTLFCDMEFLVNFERGEVRIAQPTAYESLLINEIDYDLMQMSFESQEQPWQLDSSQLNILAGWNRGDKIQLTQLIVDFDTLDEEALEELEVIKVFYRDEVDLKGWILNLAVVLNPQKEEVIFCWNWNQKDPQSVQ